MKNRSLPGTSCVQLGVWLGWLFGSVVVGLCTTAPLAGQATPAAEASTNVLFVLIDDLGYGDLGCYGGTEAPTPAMDRLAAEGLRFAQFYVASPICSPSRVAFTTGSYPARHGIHSYLASREQNRRRGMRDFLDPDIQTVGKLLQSAGYATAHFGKWHQGGGRDVDDAPHPSAYGFDESLVSFEGLGDRLLPPGRLSDQSAALGQGEIKRLGKHQLTEQYVDRAIQFISQAKQEQQPFYLQLWLNDVHDPFQPSDEQRQRLLEAVRVDGELPKWAEDPVRVDYNTVLFTVDQQLERLLTELDRLALSESTLVILAGDNGPTAWPRYARSGRDAPGSTGGLRGRKWSLYEGGIRQPFIIRCPGRIPAGQFDRSTLLSAIDFLPTLCEWVDLEHNPDGLDGTDMSAAWQGTPVQRDRPLFFEYGRDPTYLRPARPIDQSPNLAVRDGAWKLLTDADRSRLELYHFDSDVETHGESEYRNVAGEYPEVVDRLSAQLAEWRASLPGNDSSSSGTLARRQFVALRAGQRVPSADFVDVRSSEIQVVAVFMPRSGNGVLLAHGGEANGYSLYLKDGVPTFTVAVSGERYTIRGNRPISVGRYANVVAMLTQDLELKLSVNDAESTGSVACPLLSQQPLDELSVGEDRFGRVGDYPEGFDFEGTYRALQVVVKNVNQTPYPSRMVSRFAAPTTANTELESHPNPISSNRNWMPLDAEWQYSLQTLPITAPEEDDWLGKIVIPFPIESILSEVQSSRQPGQVVWYRTQLKHQAEEPAENFELCVGPTLSQLHVWMNGTLLEPIEDDDGTQRFRLPTRQVDVESTVRQADELLIAVVPNVAIEYRRDSNQANPALFSRDPWRVSGLTAPVWIEASSAARIDSAQVAVIEDPSQLRTRIQLAGREGTYQVQVTVKHETETLFQQQREVLLEQVTTDEQATAVFGSRSTVDFVFPIDQPLWWSPQQPDLYTVEIELSKAGQRLAEHATYGCLRRLELRSNDGGWNQIWLNGEPFPLLAVRHHGWWPDGLATPPNEEAMLHDLTLIKRLGFNAVYLDSGLQASRWYHWADRLGLIVIHESPELSSGGEQMESQGLDVGESWRRFHRYALQLSRHPANGVWISRPGSGLETLFEAASKEASNARLIPLVIEADDMQLVELTRRSDAEGRRAAASAPENPREQADDRTLDEPKVGEAGDSPIISFAQVGLNEELVRGHVRNPYLLERRPDSRLNGERLLSSYRESLEALHDLEQLGLAGVIVDSLTDSEATHNGFQTFDRASIKLEPELVKRLHESLWDD